MDRYLGLDVHRDSCTFSVLSAAGKQVRRDVIETNGHALVRYLRQLRGQLHLCIEEGTWSEWLYEILSPHAAETVVYQGEWTPGPKSDALDARGLADKLRTGQISGGVFKAPKRYRRLRESVRIYQMLTQDVARTKNRIKSLYRRRGIPCSGDQVYSPAHREDWASRLPEPMRPSLKLLSRELDEQVDLKGEAKKSMLAAAQQYPVSRVLQTAPGLGPTRVALLMATVITPFRFRTKRQFWAYCGFAVVTRSSADWEQIDGGWSKVRSAKPCGLNRNHNPTLKNLFRGAAITVLGRSGLEHPLRVAYDRQCAAGTKPSLARLTTARKIAATVLTMWKKQEAYDPSR